MEKLDFAIVHRLSFKTEEVTGTQKFSYMELYKANKEKH